jgi:hypothetical protein
MRRSPAASGTIHPCHPEIELSSGVVLVGDAALSLCDHGPGRNGDATASSPMILRKYTLVCEMFSMGGVSLPNAPEIAADPRAVPRGWGGWPWGPA